MSPISRLSFFILCSFSFLKLYSQTASFNYHPVDEILSKELIKDVSKDPEGYVWFATDQGVLRFDGRQTELYFKELPSPYTKTFLSRENGQFLIVSDVGIHEVVKTNGDSVAISPFVMDGSRIEDNFNLPKSAHEDHEGNIWIGETTDLVKISNKGLIKRYFLGNEFKSINYHRSFSFAEDAFNNLWITPYVGELISYDKDLDSLVLMDIDYPLTEVTSIISIKGDYLIIAGREGLLKLKVDSDRNILKREFFPVIEEVSTLIAIDDIVYVGTWTEGLYEFNFADEVPQITKVDQLGFNDVLGFHYDDKSNELWVTGSENVGVFKKMPIASINAIGRRWIETVTTAENGELYYSTGQNIYKYDAEDATVEEVLFEKKVFLNKLLVEEDELWVGDAFGGIFSYNMVTGDKKDYLKIIDNAVTCVFKDKNDNKWFAGNSRKLIKITPSRLMITYEEVDTSSVVKEAADGTLFCSSRGSSSLFYQYDPELDSFMVMDVSYSFTPTKNIQVIDFEFEDDQTIFIASDNGFLKGELEDNKLAVDRLSLEGIDEDEPIRAVVKCDSMYWLSISTGLLAYDQRQAVLFSRESGLPSRVLKQRGLVRGKENQVIVTTTKGVAVIPEANKKIPKTEQPIIKRVIVNGMPVAVGEEPIKVEYRGNIRVEYLSLEYPALNLSYQTMIEGKDEDWLPITNNRNIDFVGYNEGNYTFKVRARYTGETWSDPITFSYYVPTPWYRSWWGYLIFLVAAAIVVSIVSSVYNSSLLRQKRQLEKTVQERTEEINNQKNEIISQKNEIIRQKEELLDKKETVFASKEALSEADLNFLKLKEKQLQDQIEQKNKQITTHTLHIIQKNETLKELKGNLEELLKNKENVSTKDLRQAVKVIDGSFKLDKDWDDFKLYFEQIYTGFYSKLKINHPELSQVELRHCALIRLNLSIAECSSILGISHDSTKVSRTRIRKKLGLPGSQKLQDFILSL